MIYNERGMRGLYNTLQDLLVVSIGRCLPLPSRLKEVSEYEEGVDLVAVINFWFYKLDWNRISLECNFHVLCQYFG